MTSRLLLTLLHFCLYTIITILTTLPSIASAEKITFPKIDRRPKPDVSKPREMRRLPKYNLGSHEVIDLRNRDLSKLDLCDSFEDLMYIESDSRTVWPTSDKMPSGFDPQEIMELGKNPGLGIRSLHKQGITGRGVRIAILDLPLLVDHQEYADRLQLYEEIHVQIDAHSTGHGCMTASVAVGKTVGVAPEAELFFIGHYEKKRGAPALQSLVQGIHRIVEINEQLPQEKKIRAISISRRWTRDDLSDKEYKIITDAVQKARAAGMLVVTCCVDLVHEGCDYAGLGRPPLADPDAFESYKPVSWAAERFWEGHYHPYADSSEGVFFVPLDSRTTASEDGIDEYFFDRCGGFSKAPPYTAGVYALAVQVDPAITPERFWALATKTGRTIEAKREGKRRCLGPILDPVKLIRS
ncbi:MAG: S8 family serine peptidase, partial [Planctomycetota bacterium]